MTFLKFSQLSLRYHKKTNACAILVSEDSRINDGPKILKITKCTFSHSLIIHQVRTKKISTVREVWIPGFNQIEFHRPSKHLEFRQKYSAAPRVVFSTPFTVFGYPDETLSFVFDSGAPAARRAAKRSPIVITGMKRKPMKDFLMVIMASGITRGRVRTTTTTTESRNMAAILQKIG